MFKNIAIVCAASAASVLSAYQTVSITAYDGVEITADVYRVSDDLETPFILLFHQAGYSRGEYREIAPRLNKLGYNCMAVDLRSGSGVRGVLNETAREARRKSPDITYLDAETDILDALFYAREHYARGPIILWGSSFSASLSLIIAAERPRVISGVVAFSPGEYFNDLDKPYGWVAQKTRKLEMPVFVASARNEERRWDLIYNGMYSTQKAAYRPVETPGMHGSRALWPEAPDSEGYWQAVTAFLRQYFPQ